jgi:formyl-CoA transferase
MANGLWWNAIQVQGMLCGARTVVRPPREHSVSALANLYRCRDGRWFLMSLTADERRWPDLAACLERADLVADPRFATIQDRRLNASALIAILDDVFARKDWADWRAILERSGIAFGVVGTLDDIPGDRQMVDSGALVPIEDARAGATLTVSSPLEIDGQQKTKPTLAPGVGEHTTEVLREAGFAASEIERLLQSGVVAQGASG